MWQLDDYSPVDVTGPLNPDCDLNDGVVLRLAGIDAWAGGGTWFDASGAGNDGTLTGSPTWTPTPYGPFVLFTGSNRVATNYTPAGPFAVACWYWHKADQAANATGEILSSRTGSTGFELANSSFGSTNHPFFQVLGTTGNVETGTPAFVVGRVHRLYAVYDSAGRITLYMDGVRNGTATGVTMAAGGTLTVGANPGGGNNLANAVGDVSYWSGTVPLGLTAQDAFAAADYDQSSRGYPDLLRRVSPRAWSFGAAATTSRGLMTGGLLGSRGILTGGRL